MRLQAPQMATFAHSLNVCYTHFKDGPSGLVLVHRLGDQYLLASAKLWPGQRMQPRTATACLP